MNVRFRDWMFGGGRRYAASAIVRPVLSFIRTEQLSSLVLLLATAAALIWVNASDSSYHKFWEAHIALDFNLFAVEESLEGWVNDGLMAIFFFVIGLEIKRELVHGELSSVRKAALPAIAALGGMVVPALIYAGFNIGGEGARGWGIPMATDIAFALGVLALLGRFIPPELRIFLLGVAVVDDIGAILVIAIFYTDQFDAVALGWGALVLGGILASSRLLRIRNPLVYWVLGALFWVAILKSGVHATLAGVILGLLAPASAMYRRETFRESAEGLIGAHETRVAAHDEEGAGVVLGELEELAHHTESPLERLERQVHPWSSYAILPIFALANAGILLRGGVLGDAFASAVTWGVLVGLPAGKVLGIGGATWLAVKAGLAELPRGVRWTHIVGVGLLAGIGFTVSIFIAGLAFDEETLVNDGKIGILLASVASGVGGYLFLRYVARAAPRA